MYPYFLFAAVHHLISSPTFSVRPCSSVGRVTVDLFRRSWVRFPPRSKDFFFASCGSLFPFTIACRTGVIFCVFQANRGESEASAWRARVACEGRIAKKSRLSPYHCSSRSGVQIWTRLPNWLLWNTWSWNVFFQDVTQSRTVIWIQQIDSR